MENEAKTSERPVFDAEDAYRAKWMSDDQWHCAKMFAKVVRGFHHVGAEFKPHGYGIKVAFSGSLATWDSNTLTRLIVASHDEMVRVEIVPSGPYRVGIAMWRRHQRDGSIMKRMPTIDEAVAMHRTPTRAEAGAGDGGEE
jgi:hypothetical protein